MKVRGKAAGKAAGGVLGQRRSIGTRVDVTTISRVARGSIDGQRGEMG